jgi:alkyl sulfatase BDS1-like metallo-beta-lactamase superfamily hydrolase
MDFRGLIPDVRVDNDVPYTFTLGDRRFEVHARPGAEGADNVVLYLPDDKVLLTGDFFGPQFPQFPNLFTMRGEKMRKPVEYIKSIDQLLTLDIHTLLPSHLDPVRGADEIRAGMIRIREAVDFVHSETVAGMNAGKSLSELMVEIRLPERLLLSETHGKVSWAVKSIWEYYATWFHFDRTSELYATPQSAVLDDLAGIIDADAALSLVREKLQRSEPEQALLLLEIFEGFDKEPDLMELRIEVLSQLRERATVTGNDYELYWLDSELEKARRALLQ